MTTVLLVIHLLLALALIGTVLLQKSEGGGLGIGGGGGGGGGIGGFLTGRGTANLLTRTTAILAACFFVTSLILTLLASGGEESRSILDQPGAEQGAPLTPDLGSPAESDEPSVPVQ